MSEFRKDPITGRWVIIASRRAQRPRQLGAGTDQAQAEPCPFCAGNEALTPAEVWADRTSKSEPNMPGWSVRVVPNKYPALSSDRVISKPQAGVIESMAGIGAHEVVIECPDHGTNLALLSEAQWVKILSAYRERARSLAAEGRWRYVLIYKNQGERAGATLEHLHSQIIALARVPKEAVDELDGARSYFESTGRCFYCALVEGELREQTRLVLEHERFAALCPFAPRFAYET